MKFRGVGLVGPVLLAVAADIMLFACDFSEEKPIVPVHPPTTVPAFGDAGVIPSGIDGGTWVEDTGPGYPLPVSLGGSCGDHVCDPLLNETDATCIDCAPAPKAGDGRCDIASECGTADCGKCWFADPVGSPTADGTQAKPYSLLAILQNATVQPGDSIWLQGGDYGSGGPTAFPTTLKGTAAKPIRIAPMPGQMATIRPGIGGPAAEYLTFAGITIRNDGSSRAPGDRTPGIVLKLGLTLEDVRIYDTGIAGAQLAQGPATIEGCILQGNGVQTAPNTFDGSGVRVDGATGAVTVQGSTFSRNFAEGVRINSVGSGGIVNVRGSGFVDHAGGAYVVAPAADTTVAQANLANSMVVTRATAPATTADPGVVFGMTANVPQDSAALRESVFVSTGTSPAPLVTLHRYQGFVAVISNQFRGPAFVSEVSERISAQWEANQYVVPGGDAQGKYFEFSIVPDALAKKTFAEWQGISSNGVGRDLDSKLTFVPPTDPQVVGQKLSLTNLRGVVFVSLAEAAPSVTLDLRPYLRVGEKFTLIDANQRGALVVPETLFDGRPLKVTLPSAAPVPLAGVPLAPAAMRPTSAPTFYAFQVRTP